MWNDQWAAMRTQFLARAKDRLVKLSGAIDHWASDTSDMDCLMRIYKDFHWLAGVGGTYQLPEISALGANGETICLEVMDRKREVAADDPQRLKDILESVNAVMSSAV
jgi:chemotaxis protein histidine kinase CheA